MRIKPFREEIVKKFLLSLRLIHEEDIELLEEYTGQHRYCRD
jgi:hypothetical protein